MIFAGIQDPRFFDWLMNQPAARQAAVDAYLNAPQFSVEKEQQRQALREAHGITVTDSGSVFVGAV
jgi:hypothetical protein